MREQHREHGFGMIEVVVSIFMLGLLAIAFIPVLLQGLRATAQNSTLATATQLVNQSLELARAGTFTSCAALEVFAGQPMTGTDARGTVITVTRTLPTGCNAADGIPELLSVTATAAGSDEVLAYATTHVAVTP